MASGIHSVRCREHVLQQKAIGKAPSRAEVRGVPRWSITSGRQWEKRVGHEHRVPEGVGIDELVQVISLPDVQKRRI
jgi:hypothetical protein